MNVFLGYADGGLISEPLCQPVPPTTANELILPFGPGVDAVCTHSSGLGSHSWPNAFFALDLATPYGEPPAIITASADGKAFAFLGEGGSPCQEPAGTPAQANVDDCGHGWGNNVRVLHADGYYTMYAHLERVLVTNGEGVRPGQPLGVEGWTGAAGHRHLHWSLQRLPGTTKAEWESEMHEGWNGLSVPFSFPARLNGSPTVVDTAQLQCAPVRVGQAPSAQQPHLRADPPSADKKRRPSG
jgi:murein DD-endopeptidase MepM/ murein hydrolase activator NlpD